MPKHGKIPRNRWISWLDTDGILPLLRGRLGQHEKKYQIADNVGFWNESLFPLGTGISRILQLV